MLRSAVRLAVLIVLGLFGGTTPCLAEAVALAPFKIDPARPDVIEMNGAISSGAALAFRRTLMAAPKARLLVLNSPGGDVDAGLLIADDVHVRKLATFIPEGSVCASACAYIFLAGNERQVDGALGVHQLSSDRPSLEQAQTSIADVIDILNRFDTPVEVLTIMFRTPADDLHVFTSEEVATYGINRKNGNAASAAPSPQIPAPSSALPSPGTPSPSDLPNPAPAAAAVEPPTLDMKTTAALSTLETNARAPTRIAIYQGLDFFGEDLGTTSVADASSCAAKCFEMAGACRAFTFNTMTPAGRGPNCFLKAGQGTVDGNSAAFSGVLLSRTERDAGAMTIGVIDPQGDLYRDVDIPGLDLSRRAHPGAATEFKCRRACVETDRCVAFTFVKPKKECWLKSGIGTARAMAGAVTGGKKIQTFTPTTITLQ